MKKLLVASLILGSFIGCSKKATLEPLHLMCITPLGVIQVEESTETTITFTQASALIHVESPTSDVYLPSSLCLLGRTKHE